MSTIKKYYELLKQNVIKVTDDFDWNIYNLHYRGELMDIIKHHTLILNKGDYLFEKDSLVQKRAEILPLHPNHSLLYETILQLKPESALEVGCGGGDHLNNLTVLLPDINLYGLDLSDDQIAFCKERHPDLKAVISQYDLTLPLPYNFAKSDIAYTQAVLMHMQTGNGHLVALSNLFKASTKQLVLMENWSRHNFVEDIKKLFSLGVIPWSEIHFYYKYSEEYKRPHLLIISSVKLNDFPILSDYSLLSDPLKQ